MSLVRRARHTREREEYHSWKGILMSSPPALDHDTDSYYIVFFTRAVR
jgi:hypothetical protein